MRVVQENAPKNKRFLKNDGSINISLSRVKVFLFHLFVLFLFSLKASIGWEVLDQIRALNENEKRETTRGKRTIPNARPPKGRSHPNITQRKNVKGAAWLHNEFLVLPIVSMECLKNAKYFN